MSSPNYYGQPSDHYVAKSTRKRWPIILSVLIGVLVLLCAIGSLAIVGNAVNESVNPVLSLPSTYGAPSSPTPAAKAAPKSSVFGAGDYQVGAKSDPAAGTIKPGTYSIRTTGFCYWARLKGFSGGLDEVIANGNLDGDQVVRLTLKKTDKGLQLQGDCQLR
jgi:hypothetical protein